MDEEIIKKLREAILNSRNADGHTEIDKNNYFKIENINQEKNVDNIAFVDGGNAEIFSSAEMCFGKIRTAYTLFSGKEKIAYRIFESYTLIKSKEKNGDIFYEAELMPKNEIFSDAFFEFNSMDKHLKKFNRRADIRTILGLLRRLVEIKTCSYLIKEAKNAHVVVLDGSFECATPIEEKFMGILFEDASKNNVCIAALSKTSSLFAKNGVLASTLIKNPAPEAKWYFKVSNSNMFEFSNEDFDVYFAKLHEKSKHVFKIDIFSKAHCSSSEIFSLLSNNSSDAVFPGYPYGLIEADRVARVSNSEIAHIKNLFKAKLGNLDLDYYLNSSNAHDVLDKISF